jgi:hypothetical protein
MITENRGYQKLKHLFYLAASLLMLEFSGCYYDNEMELYPSLTGCDTLNVTYSGVISSIMNVNCNSCHDAATLSGNVQTDNYDDLKVIADNGKLWGVVNHETGYTFMPKDRPQLSECDLKKIKIWINAGALNN